MNLYATKFVSLDLNIFAHHIALWFHRYPCIFFYKLAQSLKSLALQEK
jgi:hypothetical protein